MPCFLSVTLWPLRGNQSSYSLPNRCDQAVSGHNIVPWFYLAQTCCAHAALAPHARMTHSALYCMREDSQPKPIALQVCAGPWAQKQQSALQQSIQPDRACMRCLSTHRPTPAMGQTERIGSLHSGRASQELAGAPPPDLRPLHRLAEQCPPPSETWLPGPAHAALQSAREVDAGGWGPVQGLAVPHGGAACALAARMPASAPAAHSSWRVCPAGLAPNMQGAGRRGSTADSSYAHMNAVVCTY